MSKTLIEFVSATRSTGEGFLQSAPLGRSLARLRYDPRVSARITAENTDGLPEVYNAAIDADGAADVLVFTHDDVWIDDFFIVDRLLEALLRFDVVGVAGNVRAAQGHTKWAHRTDWGYLSGAVAHGKGPFGQVIGFGAVPQACELLDGVFLAARRSTLRLNGVRFDPQFRFHCYDLDFCRTARRAALRVGTWPIAITHESVGNFRSEAWQQGAALYRAKWRD